VHDGSIILGKHPSKQQGSRAHLLSRHNACKHKTTKGLARICILSKSVVFNGYVSRGRKHTK